MAGSSSMKIVPSAQSLRYLRHVLSPSLPSSLRITACHPFLRAARKHFHTSRPLAGTKTHLLSDIGEGVKEVQIIQWFVEEGAKIEEWGALCEVQSDKASTEITSKYTGVIKKIYHKRDEVVQVGDPMVDIDVEGEEDEPEPEPEESAEKEDQETEEEQPPAEEGAEPEAHKGETPEPSKVEEPSSSAKLATPAIRGLLKEHNLSIQDIEGSGKDGRVMKEDVLKHLDGQESRSSPSVPSAPKIDSKQTETQQKLTPVQSAMFKSMTASLNIPHFLYTDSINITSLSSMRTRLNTTRNPDTTPKYSYLPFMIKAVSLALTQYPILNARLDTTTDPKKPQLLLRSNHNIGVAMDTPSGLLVPVIKSVNARSIASIATELLRLSQLGQAGKLKTDDLTGCTITVSNIGNIGGEVLAPVIVEGQLAIMAVGKVKPVPIFGDDGQIQRAEMVNVSWSADHRVVDGATMARMASVVKGYLEEPGSMVVGMV